VARACELGVAMQLTNIARDVGEDARNGRLYLPRRWLTEAGIDADAWLLAPVHNAGIASVVQRLLRAADTLYRRAEHGIAALPRDCRPAIRAARLVYAEIGEKLQCRGLDSVSQRVVVSKQRKLALMARASGAWVFTPGVASTRLPELPAISFLVEACAASPQQTQSPAPTGRIEWMIDLLERQEHHRHSRRMARS
jgi:phytoene synthase